MHSTLYQINKQSTAITIIERKLKSTHIPAMVSGKMGAAGRIIKQTLRKFELLGNGDRVQGTELRTLCEGRWCGASQAPPTPQIIMAYMSRISHMMRATVEAE